MKRLRRALLEIWAILPLAVVVGFLGPFGTYLMGDFLIRVGRWWGILMGAYVLIRPTMELWRWVARATRLPQGSLVFWGMVLSSFPLAFVWQIAGREEVRLLGGYGGLLPFTLLCCLLVMVVVWWAERADAHLLRYYDSNAPRETGIGTWVGRAAADVDTLPSSDPASTRRIFGPASGQPRFHARLSPQFEGNILALESEDHYVRVHGKRQSELLLLRLRDAIDEMDDRPGEQTHRSWWVARDAVAEVSGSGRNWHIRLENGTRALVARDTVDRLRRSGFLPA